MNKQLETLVLAAIDLHKRTVANREALKGIAGKFKLADWRDFVAAILAREYGVDVKQSQKFKWATFDKDTAAEQMLSAIFKLHPKYDAWANQHRASQPKREAAPRKVYAAIEAEILSSGMTKAQFNALIAELKANIAFE
jgi:hypothetical protein